jgi:hypothetical protein
MGNAFNFSFWNPTGHYKLNLQHPIEREVAMMIIVINKEANRRILAGEMSDKSQMGNKSCMRNERYNS